MHASLITLGGSFPCLKVGNLLLRLWMYYVKYFENYLSVAIMI